MQSNRKSLWSRNKRGLIFLVPIGAVLAAILFFQQYFQKPTYVTVRIKGSPGNWWWMTPRPPDWLVNSVHVGDKEYNAVNQPTAEVLEVNVYDAGGPTRDIYITAKLDVRYNKQTNKYRYKGEPLEIGGPISLSLGSTFFPGMVVEIIGPDAKPKDYVELTVHIKHKDRWPFEYDAIVVGDRIEDGEGRVIAEILTKDREPAEREAETITGQIVKAYSPVLDDIYFTVKLRVEKRNSEFIYREEQYVKVGNQLWLMFPHYNISGAYVTSIE